MYRALLFACVVSLSAAAPVRAQQPATAAQPNRAELLRDLFASLQGRFEVVSANHYRLIGRVDLPVPGQTSTRIFADLVEFFFDTNLLIATGNVAFTNPEGRIGAERIEFNVAEGTAVFHQASGIVALPDGNRAEFGNQEPDIYFWGDRIDKLGPKKYKITRGGFSACVQPTPRWEVTSGSITINVDDYALARSTVLRVKGVPLLFLPAIYYPLQEDQRSTGFLLPSYGTSTLRGGSLSNAFFWAISRSQDATFYHDWFTRAGTGTGAEYRYVANAGASGEFRAYRFSQQRSEYANDGRVSVLPENISYEIEGSVVHALRPTVQARGRAEYATDLLTRQLYQQNVYQASNPRRLIEGGISGYWGVLNASALYQRTEVFSTATRSSVTGSTPRINAAVAPTRLFGSAAYASVATEFAHLPYRVIGAGVVEEDRTMSRFDLAPSLRVPFSRLPFLTVNSLASYRTTYYSRSLDLRGAPVAEPIGRTYFGAQSQVVGPVLTKIWDTPASTTVQRMKHVIEPAFTFDYVSDIGNAARLPSLSHTTTDVVIGGSARVTYGLTNRFLARQRATATSPGTSREFLTIGLQQTYYSDAEASRWDFQYAGSSNRARLVDLSPIALTTRFTPTPALNTNARLEYDTSGLGLQTISIGGGLQTSRLTTDASFSRVVYSPTSSSSSLALSSTMRFLEGRSTGVYGLNWDLARGYVVSQRVGLTYMAQCCGLQVDYQQYNFPELAGFPVTADRRLNFGVVLAGLGTFSNFFGAFGGQP